jgi:membrane protein
MEFLQTQLAGAWRRCRYLLSRFASDRCMDNAAALTYMSLFALVPLLTVSYAMASAVPAFQDLEPRLQAFLFDNLMPDTSSDIQQYLSEFSQQAKNLTGWGIAFLIVTAILMLRNIEKSFNNIWRTREHRGAISSFLLYWAVLSLSPMTIGVALGISTYLGSVSVFIDDLNVMGAAAHGLKSAPFILYSLGFTLLYAAVPNCRVPLRHAFVGGVTAALAFNLARSLFTQLVAGSSYTLIYGAFAAVPLFLLWIFLSWNIVLMGGILVHSLSAYQNQEQANRPTVLKALDILYLFWQRQQSGHPVREIELLSGRHPVVRGLDSETWSELRDIFIRHNVISETSRGHYLLSRDLHNLSFWQVKEWINEERSLAEQDDSAHLDWQSQAYQLLRGQRSQTRDALDITLAELYTQ